MITNKRPDDTADDASKASERGDHREAERLYLMAAARASQFSNQPTMQKNVGKWDKAAQRERRLAELTKGSGGGGGATPTQKPLPDWASGSDGLTFAGPGGLAGHGTFAGPGGHGTATKPMLPILNRPIDATELHRLFTGDVPNGRAWYDERDKESWVRLATKLQTMQYSEPHTVSDRPFTVENAYADIASILGNVARVFGRPASREIVNTLHRERE